MSAFFFFLCQDHWHSNVSPHLAQPGYVALGWTLDSGLMLFLMVFFVHHIMLFRVCLSSCISVCFLYVCLYVLYFFIQMQILLFVFCLSSVTLCVFFPSLLMFLPSPFFVFSSSSMCSLYSVFLSFFLFHWMAYFISGTGRWGSRLEQIANW